MASSTYSSSTVIAVMLAVTVFMAMSKGTAAAVSCGQVVNTLYPCLTYVQYGGSIPANCCNGIRALNNAAATTPDRQGVCSCLVSSLRGFNISPYSLRLAASLPAGCGVNLPYRIDPSIDCSKVR
ncbi:Non-specific lipid-transfer protein 1 [Linum grandiflorum]